MYSGAVDVLGSLTKKLKQQTNDTQGHYELFIDATQRYKQGKMDEKEFFTKISDYVVATSAMNKGTLMKNATGEMTSPPAPQAGFGIGGFVGTGGTLGGGGKEYTMPAPPQQHEPTFKPVDIEVERPSKKGIVKETTTTTITKNCIVCGLAIPKQAKFCSKCGNSQ